MPLLLALLADMGERAGRTSHVFPVAVTVAAAHCRLQVAAHDDARAEGAGDLRSIHLRFLAPAPSAPTTTGNTTNAAITTAAPSPLALPPLSPIVVVVVVVATVAVIVVSFIVSECCGGGGRRILRRVEDGHAVFGDG